MFKKSKGAEFTKRNGVYQLVYTETFGTHLEARRSVGGNFKSRVGEERKRKI